MKTNILDFISQGGAEVNIIPIAAGEGMPKIETDNLPNELPVLPLRNAVIFPGTIFPVTVGREKSVELVRDAEHSDSFIAAIPQLDMTVENPGAKDINRFGVVARVLRVIEMPDGNLSAIVQSLKRVELLEVTRTEPYIYGRVNYLEDEFPPENDREIKVLSESLRDKAAIIISAYSLAPKEAVSALKSLENFPFIVNFIATTVEIENIEEKIELLQFSSVYQRGIRLLSLLETQRQLLEIKQEINQKVRSEIDQQQREYYLNNQLRTIQEELGMEEDEDIAALREAASKKHWSQPVQEAFEKGLQKLSRFNPSAPEYSIQYSFLQFMLELPWDDKSKDNLDLKHARKVLDGDHYGLDKVKDRIMEYLAVLKLKGDLKSPILCLYGPPGVGKTSLGKSIAKALGREYERISLGGLHDEAEIRGHRKTYVGALPGRIINAIAKAGTSNPVIVLDEIDKIASDYKGDPSSALLEVLDPDQNSTFHDNYLDIDYDLSDVMFITTANDIASIQPALRDRMEMINVTGYLTEEKYEIAKRHLLPKQLEAHGLNSYDLKLEKAAIISVIEDYTHESGVRDLERKIAKICRVRAKQKALCESYFARLVKNDLRQYLGVPTSFHDKQKGNEGPGVVTGLAWTQMGGEILFVESSVSEGKGVLTMTGNLGDVMKESTQIAYQYIKSHPQLANLDHETFMQRDIHVHVPEGAVPKDGPSAGITMVTSMISAYRGQAIKSGIAMTGEMTLRGRVLPVGGIKEKILAAKRSGVHTIVLSEDNRKDIEDIKQVYIEGLNFVYVHTAEDVINFVF